MDATKCQPPKFLAANNDACCIIHDYQDDLFHSSLTTFLANVAGNFVAGYNIVKYLAMFLLWGDKSVEHVRYMEADYGMEDSAMWSLPLVTPQQVAPPVVPISRNRGACTGTGVGVPGPPANEQPLLAGPSVDSTERRDGAKSSTEGRSSSPSAAVLPPPAQCLKSDHNQEGASRSQGVPAPQSPRSAFGSAPAALPTSTPCTRRWWAGSV